MTRVLTSANPALDMSKLNFVRFITVMAIAFGYASTMPLGPTYTEKLSFVGLAPSYVGIQILFFLSGLLAWRSLENHGSAARYLKSRILRNGPMLAVITLLVVLLIYPIFGQPKMGAGDLLKYFLGTVTCLTPSKPMPGLMDDAKYMCLVQGAVWTLRWGLIFHIGTALAHKLGLWKDRRVSLVLFVLATLAYLTCVFLRVYSDVPNLEYPSLISRLAWPFLAGMTAYAYRDKLSLCPRRKFMLSGAMLLIAAIWYYAAPWSPLIEIIWTLGLCGIALSILQLKSSAFKPLNDWPNWALAIYLINWPVAQISLVMWPELSSWAVIGITLPVTIILAAMAHKLVTGPSFKVAAPYGSGQALQAA